MDIVVEGLRFFDDVWSFRAEEDSFSLAIARSDDPARWGPFRAGSGRLLVALAGRIALDPAEWQAAAVEGEGGLACRWIATRYRAEGIDGLRGLNGNFSVFLWDGDADRVYIITDPCGMTCAYEVADPRGHRVVGTHPDVVALAGGADQDWDMTSLAEFVMCGRVTAPNTYYTNVKALPGGRIFTYTLLDGSPSLTVSQGNRFDDSFEIDRADSLESLAGRLAEAFDNAGRRRSAPSLGKTAIALSGGLDSRTILSTTDPDGDRIAFCCLDQPNRESQIAGEIAHRCGVPFIALERSCEYYGENAELGVRISGGMGSIANNHYLGFRSWFRDNGVQNFLTGCYCDYLFKGLVLDKSVSRLTGLQQLGPFQDEYYFLHFGISSRYAEEVTARQQDRFPQALRTGGLEETRLEVEKLRTFPLAYEADNMQRVVPQRVLPWYLPIVDTEIVRLYYSIAPSLKLNRRLFLSMMKQVCAEGVLEVPDANTGVRVDASSFVRARARVKRKLATRLGPGNRPSSATSAWPDWGTYQRKSCVLRDIWERRHPGVTEILNDILGPDCVQKEPEDYPGDSIYLFTRILTISIWLNQRLGHTSSMGTVPQA